MGSIESKLASFVRACVAVEGADTVESVEALRWVCVGLEYVLGALLEPCAGWTGFVDAILPATDALPDAVTIELPNTIPIRGRAIWTREPHGCWEEPFMASLQVSESENVLAALSDLLR